jgi:N-acetylglucosaminyldiphosphoundecaprenol N-acetyl-beta-D-mannosaminyltransferase
METATVTKTNPKDRFVKVLKVPMYAKNIPAATQELIEVCQNESKLNRCVSATGAHGLVFAQKNPDFFQVLQDFYLNLPDGMPTVWVGKMKGAKQMDRCYGPDFFADVMQKTATTSIKHFFCGGKEGVADELKEAVGKKFNNHNVCGTYCPPFRALTEEEMRDLGKQMQDAGADVVWIGLSTPKQEKFARELIKHTQVHFVITVGAAFDFHTDKVSQAPRYIQRAGLEWFYRLCMEPKRLYKRYLEIVPYFIYYNLKELFTFSSKAKS